MNVTAQAGDTLILASGAMPLDSGDAANKRALRSTLRQRRKSIPSCYRRRAARAVAQRLLRCPAVRRASKVAVYLSIGSELLTSPLIAALRARHIDVFVPALLRGGMRFCALDRARQQGHRRSTIQARSSRPRRASEMDVVMLPLLGFDAHGTRLGQGGGHYDRALANHPFRPYRLGLAYASQQVARLPREPWDQPLQAVLTEHGLLTFPRKLFG